MSQVDSLPQARPRSVETPPAQRQAFPRNRWYVAAASCELGQRLLPRTLLGQEVVLYRKQDGTAVALSDWCPHRGFRLSDSHLIGDVVRCGYHGLEFDGSGACVKIPAQKAIPPQLRVHSYPIVESSLFAWIWMGDPNRADPRLLPKLPVLEGDAFEAFYLCERMGGNYQLLHDNLLDAVHTTYLHPGLNDSPEELELVTHAPKILIEEEMIQSTRVFERFVPNASVAQTLRLEPGAPVRRTLRTCFYAPSFHTFEDTSVDIETGAVRSAQIGLAGVTPADDVSCYNFAAMTATFDVSQPQYFEIYRNAIAQDKLAIESAQTAFDQAGSNFREINLRQDHMSMESRRIIARMVAEERGTFG